MVKKATKRDPEIFRKMWETRRKNAKKKGSAKKDRAILEMRPDVPPKSSEARPGSGDLLFEGLNGGRDMNRREIEARAIIEKAAAEGIESASAALHNIIADEVSERTAASLDFQRSMIDRELARSFISEVDIIDKVVRSAEPILLSKPHAQAIARVLRMYFANPRRDVGNSA